MYTSAFVLGFHGCDERVGEKILRGDGHLRPSANDYDWLDCAVINHVHALREAEGEPPYDSVRGAFFEGEPLYDGAGIMAKTHIQVCVRDTTRIRGYFRPIAGTMD